MNYPRRSMLYLLTFLLCRPAIAGAQPDPMPNFELSSLCTELKYYLPKDHEIASKKLRLVNACAKSQYAPTPEVVAELKVLDEELSGTPESAVARYYRAVAEFDPTRHSKGPREPSEALRPPDPTKLRKGWEQLYFDPDQKALSRSDRPVVRLRAALNLYCLTRDPQRAPSLFQVLSDNLYLKQAKDVANWIYSHSKTFEPEVVTEVLRRRGELDTLAQDCPTPPDWLNMPALVTEQEISASTGRTLANAYRKMYCETGHSAQLLNAAIALRDSAQSMLKTDRTSSVAQSLMEEAGSLANLANANSLDDARIKPLPDIAHLKQLSELWVKGDIDKVTEILDAYQRATKANDTTSDVSAAYLGYFATLIEDKQTTASNLAERFKRAAELTDQRWQSAACVGLKRTPPLFQSLKSSCRKPATRPVPPLCKHRQVAHPSGVCCFEGMFPNTEGKCVGGSCPSDMVRDGEDGCVCEDGRQAPEVLEFHCCWPGQAWDTNRKACTGDPKCPKTFVLVGDSCWPEFVDISRDRTTCERGDSVDSDPLWDDACMSVVNFHKSRLGKSARENEVSRLYENARDSWNEEILKLYKRACLGGSLPACSDGAIFAEALAPTPRVQEARVLFEQLHNGSEPYRTFGTLGFSRYVENRVQRAQMLEALCLKPATHAIEGAPVACAWLADDFERRSQAKQSNDVNALICAKGRESFAKIAEENQLPSRHAVRRACERVASVARAQNQRKAWSDALRGALRALPNDVGWREQGGRTNEELRDELANQPKESKHWCGRPQGRPGQKFPCWSMYRCWPKDERNSQCLGAENYSEGGHGCPGDFGADDEKVCCPIEIPSGGCSEPHSMTSQ